MEVIVDINDRHWINLSYHAIDFRARGDVSSRRQLFAPVDQAGCVLLCVRVL
jgi:hypothetical protein